MSIEACVDELYGDTRDKEWKEEEVKRLKAEQGVMEMEEPNAGEEWKNAGKGIESSISDVTAQV